MAAGTLTAGTATGLARSAAAVAGGGAGAGAGAGICVDTVARSGRTVRLRTTRECAGRVGAARAGLGRRRAVSRGTLGGWPDARAESKAGRGVRLGPPGPTS